MGQAQDAASAPIDVDADSDATLSSDGEGPGDFTSDSMRTSAPPSLSVADRTATESSSSPVVSFHQSMAEARGEQQRTASLGENFAYRRTEHSSPAAMAMSNGKKRRLSPSPPRANGNKRMATSVLDFRYDGPLPQTKRIIQSIEDDDDEEEEEEEKKNEEEETKAESNLPTRSSMAVANSSMNVIRSSRTWICGRWFGECALHVHSIYMTMTLYSMPTGENGYGAKIKFNGSLMCNHLSRFSLSNSGRAPFYAVLQLVRGETAPLFSGFYDSIFAQVTEQDGPSLEIDLYGAILFFDDELELARCKSLADVSSGLRKLMEVLITNEEAAQVLQLRRPEHTRSNHNSPPASPKRATSTSVLSAISGKVKDTLNALTSMLSADRYSPPTAKLRQTKLVDTDASDQESVAMSARFRTSSRRKSLLQLQSREHVEEVVQLSGGPDDSPVAEASAGGERRSTRVASKQIREQQKRELERLVEERKFKVLLMYPFDPVDRSGQITIHHGDIDRLKPGEFLNDSIIDFYLRYFWRHVQPWQQSRVYFFSSHFFTQLSGGRLSGSLTLPEERFMRVARWTQKDDLFEKRFIFVPINDSCHWSIAVICNPGSAIMRMKRKHRSRGKDRKPALPPTTVFDVDDPDDTIVIDATEEASSEEEADEQARQDREVRPPCILFLDSLRCHQKKKICTLLRTYLQYEYTARFGQAESTSTSSHEQLVTSFNMEALQLIEPEIPLQSNSSDCGVFLLMYCAQIIQRFPDGLNHDDVVSKLASSVSRHIFDDSHVREFRDYLHQLLFTLQRIEKRGGTEDAIKTEGLEFFVVES